jgi:hypothetical protein
MKYAVLLSLPLLLSCGRPPARPADIERARASARRHGADALQVLDLVGRRIDEFFARRQPKIEGFVDEMFGFRSKWRATFWRREDFERHVRRRFEAALFRPEDFEREVAGPVRQDLAFALEASEARVAADLAGWARSPRGPLTARELQPRLEGLMAPLVSRDLGMNLVSIAGSELAAAAAAAVIPRAGAAGTAVVAGAGASWWTAGISLAVGIAAGIAIDAAVGEAVEDEARAAVNAELTRLRSWMLEKEDGLWWAARRAIESHVRALEQSAVRLVEEGFHDPRGV